MSERKMSIVEETLRGQREAWQEISQRVSKTSSRELPMEPPKRILLFGVGSSLFAAKLAAYAIIRDKSRTRTPVIACNSLAIGNEVIPQKGDWAFAITHRATTQVTIDALEQCDRAGAFTIIVSGKDTPQPESARFVLATTPLERCEPHTASLTGAICAVTTLLMGEKAVEEWDALRSLGDPDLDVFRKRAGKGPTTLMGEWEGEWLAKEAALKMMEMARLPVRAFGSEEYFHGPKFSEQKNDRIWHISLPKDPRNSDIKADHQIGIFGATPLAWIPALVELQWLALAVATNLGTNPDDPRA